MAEITVTSPSNVTTGLEVAEAVPRESHERGDSNSEVDSESQSSEKEKPQGDKEKTKEKKKKSKDKDKEKEKDKDKEREKDKEKDKEKEKKTEEDKAKAKGETAIVDQVTQKAEREQGIEQEEQKKEEAPKEKEKEAADTEKEEKNPDLKESEESVEKEQEETEKASETKEEGDSSEKKDAAPKEEKDDKVKDEKAAPKPNPETGDEDSEKSSEATEEAPATNTSSDSAESEASRDGKSKSKDGKGTLKRDSLSNLFRNSWKDSLNVRKEKLTQKRQVSVSNLSSLPATNVEDHKGSISKRIGKAVIMGVNKLRGISGKERGNENSKESDESQESEGSENENETGESAAIVDEDPDMSGKRIGSLPNLSTTVATPPQTPRRNSDPAPVVPGILSSGPRDTSRPKSNVKFNEIVTVRRTWAKKDYDRKGEVTWKLTPDKAIEIRNELNEFKREMDIHEESRCNTHFY